MKRCIIIGAAGFDRFDFKPNDGDFIIAADGGFEKCGKIGIKPHITVGDFDSLGYIPECDNKTVLPCVKDITDMYKAVEMGIDNDCDEFHIFGGAGGRTDHTLANISLIASLSQKGKKAYLYSDKEVITALTNGKISFDKEKKGFISVFSFTDECIVSESGLKYNINEYKMKNNFAIGVSNEFIGKNSEISAFEGTVIIIYEY